MPTPNRIKSRKTERPSRRMALLRRAGFFKKLPDDVTVVRATNLDDLRNAYKLVHEVFLSQGYISPFPGSLRIRSFEAIPSTITCVAKSNDGEVIGVQSLIPDTQCFGLPSDQSFRKELDTLRSDGKLLCEAANESVSSEYRKTSIPTGLMRCCFAHAVSIGCTDLVTAVSPGHAKFYGLMGFETITPIRDFSEGLKDPVVVVRFNLEMVRSRVAQANTQDTQDDAILVDYYVHNNPYLQHIEQWSVLSKRIFKDPSSLRILYNDLSKLLSRCSLSELRAISQVWDEQTFISVVCKI